MTSKLVSQVLKDAKALIDTPAKWTKWTFASERPLVGRYERGTVPYAVHAFEVVNTDLKCFCSSGAIIRANGTENDWYASPALIALRGVIGGGDVATWNDADERTHDEVMDAFNHAIMIAELTEAAFRETLEAPEVIASKAEQRGYDLGVGQGYAQAQADMRKALGVN